MRATTGQRARGWSPADARRHVEACLGGGIRAVFQPIVDLPTRGIVAFEALARPPAGSVFESPGPMFVAAKQSGLLADLDAACRNAALAGALDARLPTGISLFVNVEPDVIRATAPADVAALFALRSDLGIHPVLEITERAFTERPDRLLAVIDAARAAGWSIALDDVGVNPDSLALLPFVRPDVVRVDGSLVHGPPGRKAGYVAAAIRTYVERTGAVVLGECIESEEHVDHALAFGASLGQGWLFGRPGPLPALGSTPIVPALGAQPARRAVAGTPFGVVRNAGVATRAATREVFRSIARGMEADALADAGRPVVLVVMQHARQLAGDVAPRLGEVGNHSAFVAVLGVDMPERPASGVIGVAVDGDDDLANEWAVVVVGPRYSTALVARAASDTGPDGALRCEYAVTSAPEVVHAAAETLIRRCVTSGSAVPTN